VKIGVAEVDLVAAGVEKIGLGEILIKVSNLGKPQKHLKVC